VDRAVGGPTCSTRPITIRSIVDDFDDSASRATTLIELVLENGGL